MDKLSRSLASSLHCRFWDSKFQNSKRSYYLQPGMAALTILVVMSLLSQVHHTVLVAAIGASSFIAFSMPHIESARPRYLIGGYIIGITVGSFFYFVAEAAAWSSIPLDARQIHIIFGALAVGVSIFLMVVTNTEHPPAAGLALGFCLSEWELMTAGVVVVAIVTISLTKEQLKPKLTNLL